MTRDEIIAKIIPAMVAAPSAHNTQPWQFAVQENEVVIRRQIDRCLDASDQVGREAYISLGCACMNGIVAAAVADLVTHVAYEVVGRETLIHLTFSPGPVNKHLAGLASAIFQRRTNRAPFTKQPLTADEQAQLKATYEASVMLVQDEGQKKQLAQLVADGTFKALAEPGFKKELSQWVRHNWTRQADGMPGYATGIPAPLSLIAPLLVRVLPLHKQEAPVAREQINSAAAIAIFVTKEDEPTEWIKTGMRLEQLWLEVTKTGLVAMPQAAAIEADSGIRQHVQSLLQTDQLPQAMLRIGHSSTKQLPRALPRRSVQDCLA